MRILRRRTGNRARAVGLLSSPRNLRFANSMNVPDETHDDSLTPAVSLTGVAAEATAPAAPSHRSRAQQLLQTERSRIRHIESTLSELIQELASELLSSESKLAELEELVDDRTNEVQALRAELAAVRTSDGASHPDAQSEQEELRRQLAKAHKHLNLRAQELNELRAQLVELSLKSASGNTADASANAYELADLRAERQMLIERLADAESRLQQFAQFDVTEIDNLRRRFEMAVQDVRELKQKNEQLETELAKTRKTPAGKSGGGGGGLDWEAKKQAILAQLDSDDDPHHPDHRHQRISIEGTLRITDEIVTQKDKEIDDLRRQLESHDIAESLRVTNAEAIAAIIDKDEVILQQRENLRRQEAEAREKHRKAEVDLALERAKLARERSLFEEKVRAFEKERAQLTGGNPNDSTAPSKPSKGGRWLARLGLKDDKS